MKFTQLELEGLVLIEPKVFADERGFFTERWKESEFLKNGIDVRFLQDNFSRSSYRVLRGLHYQYDPPQSKLITCTRGQILDVAVDIRKNSKTYGQHFSVILNGDQPRWLWVPAGFAHGFSVLSQEGADLLYKVNAYWSAKGENGLIWNDPDLNIDWKISDPLVSAKDAIMSSWQDFKRQNNFF